MRWVAAGIFAVATAWAQPQVTVVVPGPGLGPGPGGAGLRASQLGFGWSAGSPVSRFLIGAPFNIGAPFSRLRGGVGSFAWNQPLLYSGWYGSYVTLPGQYPQVPAAPGYAFPGEMQPVAEVAPPLVAPEVPDTQEWADIRSSFDSASVSVTAARAALEELRSRLSGMGLNPRAGYISGVANAEAALKQAQNRMAAGSAGEARVEIQRAAYIARQVLKEFGR